MDKMNTNETNLCDFCLRTYSACMNEHENMPKLTYGSDGQFNDAVLECDWFMQKL
jgi:hypothetical protein